MQTTEKMLKQLRGVKDSRPATEKSEVFNVVKQVVDNERVEGLTTDQIQKEQEQMRLIDKALSNTSIPNAGNSPTLLYVALDKSQQENLDLAHKLTQNMPGEPFGFKVNIHTVLNFSENALSPHEYLTQLRKMEKPIFLDLKLHNGPTPMIKIVEQIKDLVDIIDAHASIGQEQMHHISSVLKGSKTKLYALTVLTHDKITDTEKTLKKMCKLIDSAIAGGADGIIMPPTMLKEVRKRYPDIPVICPGIRPEWFTNKKANYQSEISTPSYAMSNGANALVVGTPIHSSKNPCFAAKKILEEMQTSKPVSQHTAPAQTTPIPGPK